MCLTIAAATLFSLSGTAAAASASQSTTSNWSCRMEPLVMAAQPGIASTPRVLEAGTAFECLNLMLGPDTLLRGEIWLEWLNPETDAFEPVVDGDGVLVSRQCALSTVKDRKSVV